MKFEASKAAALNRLNNFVEQNLSEYSKLRNFDFGPENRTNISGLSPYIAHGVINEKEVIEKSLLVGSELSIDTIKDSINPTCQSLRTLFPDLIRIPIWIPFLPFHWVPLIIYYVFSCRRGISFQLIKVFTQLVYGQIRKRQWLFDQFPLII